MIMYEKWMKTEAITLFECHIVKELWLRFPMMPS